MFTKPKEDMNESRMQPTWEYLIATERGLRRNNRLCRILQPVGSAVFLFNLLLTAMNFAAFFGGGVLRPYLEKLPVLPALVAHFPRGSWGGLIAFSVAFAFLIPLAICGAITGVTYLLERRKGVPEKPALCGTLAQRARAMVYQAETVYELRRAMPAWSIYPETGILTALSAVPVVVTLLQYAKGAEPSVFRIAVACCALLLCLFVLFWVYALLFKCFALLNSLFYFSPGEWKLYTLYQELDAYWESVDPAEYARRERRRQEQSERKKRRKSAPADEEFEEE